MNLRRKIEGVLTRQAAKQAGAIRAALRNSLDVDALVADWERQNFTTMSKADARAWAQMNAQPRNLKAIRAAVLQAVATGYLLGQNAAQAYYAKAKTGRKLVKAAPTAEDIDSWLDADFWDSWTAGNKPAALLVKPPGALSDLLDKAGATINGLNRTTMNRLGTILGDGLERGLSGKSIAGAIESLLDDPARALTIANTEMARAMSTASMDTYAGFGVEMVEWLHADFCTCELCTEAEAMGPQPFGFDWSMGDGVTEPPMHPNCICSIAPVIDEGDGSGLDLFDFGDVLEMSATINKYDPDQPRDELGRFGSGGGAQTENIQNTLNAVQETKDRLERLEVADHDAENQIRILTNDYKSQGMSPNKAKWQAEADMLRLNIAKAAEREQQRIDEQVANLKNTDPDYVKELEENRAYGQKYAADLIENGNITVAFSSANFEQLLQDGRFKSQFETKTSSGKLDNQNRRIAETAIVGNSIDTKTGDRPIYGYLTNNDEPSSQLRGWGSPVEDHWREWSSINSINVEQYGDLRIVMNDDIRGQSTYVIGDSLTYDALGQSLNAPITADTFVYNGFNASGGATHLGGKPAISYVETQIHGGLSTNQISTIYAPAGTVESVKALLDTYGLNVPVVVRK